MLVLNNTFSFRFGNESSNKEKKFMPFNANTNCSDNIDIVLEMGINNDIKKRKTPQNNVYEIIAAYRQATLHILTVVEHKNQNMEYDADIFDAAEFGDLDTLKSYWSDQINIDWQDLDGMDLVMTACKFGNKDIISYLLTLKPDLTKKNKKGQTALDIALELNSKQIIDLFNEA